MSRNATTEFLHSQVYPNLDAVSAGLLAHLNPKRSGARTSSYTLDCPSCGATRRAFYYPGGGDAVFCNRKNECKAVRTSLWDIVRMTRSLSDRETFLLLCESAGVAAPQQDPALAPATAIAHGIERMFKSFLADAPEAMQYLMGRGFTEAEIASMPLGYYPTRRELIVAGLQQRKIPLDRAIALGVLPAPGTDTSSMSGMIVGFWNMDGGEFRLWGRKLGEHHTKHKYHFAVGLLKDAPYLYKRGIGALVAVEGTIDALALTTIGVRACAVGGDSVNAAQAAFLARQDVQTLIYMGDGDGAGHNGSVATIQRCERLGIATFFANVPAELKDAAKAKELGRSDDLRVLLDQAVSGGAILAKWALANTDHTGKPLTPHATTQRWHTARGVIASCTAGTRAAFDMALREAGVTPPHPEADSLSLFRSLLLSGLSLDEAQARVAAVHGLVITITAKDREPERG